MKSPATQDEYEGRNVGCQRAIAEEVLSLAEKAKFAGWTEREVVVALASASLAYLEALQKEEREARELPPRQR